ncbi:putative Ig domain-containing protein [Methanolobus bombayensis]|uniref:putative Ig domain-containing protein n=1 Tax=Methanolobus bombayensis TaxID=38023 RepID=UPI001AE1A28E|nr:putative Ig domain-containing protein [Methanolobus bombayensis]MBP1910365.1 PGF-pre-PGF domain-containing protein [Methanolobus bombayensis]
MTDRKKIAFIFILLLFFTSLASANNDDNIIFLKAGHIDTDLKKDANTTEPHIMSSSVNSELPDSSETYYLVQFNGIVKPEWKEALITTDAEILDYVPDNTFVLKMNETVRVQVESFDFVRWVGGYLPDYKYVEETDFSINSLDSENTGTIDLVVYLFEPDINGYVKSEIEVLDGIIVDESDEMLWIRLGEDRIEELTQINSVSWIEEVQELTVSNNVASEILKVNTVHNTLSLKGNEQIVAVCDIGLDKGVNDNSMHADLRGRILEIMDYSDDGAEDTTGHGTHVTGSVLGNGNLSDGEYAGTAPGAELVFQAIGDDNGDIVPLYSSISNVFQDAYNAGARIHTNSWGSDTDGVYDGYSFYLDKFAWEHPDMLILFSVGNEGEDMDDNGVVDQGSINSPATAKNCLAVGASETDRGETFSINSYSTWGTRWSDKYDTEPIKNDYLGDDSEGIAAFSSRGPTNDSRIKPDIVAPGTFIISTQASTSTAWYDWDTSSTGQYYAYMGGTSMATPLVAGSAALVREYYNDYENVANPSAALLKATLLNGAYDLTPGQYGTGDDQEVTGRPDYSQGWGRLDVENSIMAEYPKVIAYYDGESLSTGESWIHTYDYIESGNSLRATLVWTDYPGQVYSSKNLMNDLDFIITGPSESYYGNGGSTPDHINNVEGIELNSVSGGDYTFIVDGYSVSIGGEQPFSLVASFICDNNEFPAPGTLADSKNTAVSTDVVHPQGVDLSSIVMSINNVPVSFDSVQITDGYSIEYNNPSSYQTGKYNVSVTATTENGLDFSYSWNFTVDAESSNTAPVLSAIGNREVSETYPLTIELSAEDDDGDTLTFGTNASFGVLVDDTFTWNTGYSDAGAYDFEFNVTDGIDVDSEIITINVINVDRAPVLSYIGNKTVSENNTLVFSINATDDDNDTVTYSANGLPEGTTFDTNNGDFTWTPQYDESGIYNVEFIAWANGINDSETIKITVVNVDQKPILAEITNKEIDENKSLAFTISATDPDGPATIIYSANDMPAGATLDSDSGEFAWTPLYNQSGIYDVEFIATSNGLTDTQIIAITVNNIDRPPVFETIINKTVSENNTLTFAISAIDPDGDDVTYSSGNNPPNSIIDSESGEFTWTPDFDDAGSYNVEFIASSNTLNDSEIIAITVLNVDRPVELDPVDDITVNENELINFQIAGNDPDGDQISYSASVLPGNSSLDTESGEFLWMTGYTDSGIYEIEFNATANGTTDLESMIITVNNVDRKPVFDIIEDQPVDENSTLVFTVSATDPDGDDVTYSSDNIPSGSVLDSSSGEFTWTPDFDSEGTYNVQFKAASNSLNTTTDVTIIVTNTDREPVLDPINSRSVNENETLEFSISAIDIDGDDVTYSVNDLPHGATFSSSGDFSWTPSYGESGEYIVEFMASANGLNDSETITIYVGDVDRPPILDSIGDKSVSENSNLGFAISATDQDVDDVISYSIEGIPDDADFNPETRQFTWTPDYDDSGSYDVKFIASSNDLNDSETITITVLNVDRPVELDPVDDVTVNESEVINFELIGNDPDEDDITYSALDLPGNSTLDNESGEFYWVTGYNDSGIYEIEFNATANGKTDFESMLITVNDVDRKPELATIGSKNINENATLTFTVSATDLDGDDITYATSELPEGSVFDSSTRVFEWTTNYTDAGTYSINFTVSSNGLIDYENVSITVFNVNAPPMFHPVSPRTIQVSNNLQFNLNATDIDNNPLTYSADTLPYGAYFNVTSLLFNWTPLMNQTGIHYVNFTVNDSQYSDILNVSITVTNTSSSVVTTSSATGGGGGGGGGGGTSGEEYENIAVKDVSSVFVGTGDVKFDFYRGGNDIQYVSYESLKNSGTISVTIEVLVDKSAFVSSMPAGEVYRNINIWVGKVGYATEDNIADPVIGFKVPRDWIENNNIDPDSIALNRYDGGWSKLSTRQIDSDDNYLYFEARTPGFSPFAITGEVRTESSLNSVDTQFSSEDEELESNVTAEEVEPERSLNALSGLISCLILSFVCFLHRKQ